MDNADKNLHEGHRNRLREKFLKGGIESLKEHEVLEMLLFDHVKRKNTNEIAHQLIKKFGSLWQVFEAHPDELVKIKGVSPNIACSISQYMPVQRMIEKNRLANTKTIANLGQAKNYFRALLSRSLKEEFYLVCLSARQEILYRIKIREGSVNRVNVDIREVIEIACRQSATSIAIAHSHPSGDPVPSMSDDDFTRNLYVAAHLVSIHFLDHMIVGGDKVYSYWEQNRISEFERDYSTLTRTPHSKISDMLAQNKYLTNFYKTTEDEKEYEYEEI